MKQARGQCTHKDPQTRARCSSPAWKAGERLCINHDIAETLKSAALDKMLKHHPKHCTYWVFSGDRHCSCGRDEAIKELNRMRGTLRAVMICTSQDPMQWQDTAKD